MSSILYNSGREGFGNKTIGWPVDTLKLQMLAASYTFDASHSSMVDVPVGARVLAGQLLTSRTITDGYAVSAPVLYDNASDPTEITQLLIYKEDPSLIDANHVLVFFSDQVSGLPLTMDGGDYFFTGAGPNSAWFRI